MNDKESAHSKLNNNGSHSKDCPSKIPQKWVANPSSKPLMAVHKFLLAHGQNFAVEPEYPSLLDYISTKG